MNRDEYAEFKKAWERVTNEVRAVIAGEPAPPCPKCGGTLTLAHSVAENWYRCIRCEHAWQRG